MRPGFERRKQGTAGDDAQLLNGRTNSRMPNLDLAWIRFDQKTSSLVWADRNLLQVGAGDLVFPSLAQVATSSRDKKPMLMTCAGCKIIQALLQSSHRLV
jgi:hypothetical protein